MRYDKKYGSIPGAVQISAVEYDDDVAIDDEGEAWTFSELESRMFDVARGLIAIGIEPGDRVALLGPNSARWIQAAVGIQAAGGILVPLNTRFKGPELAHILAKSGARAVFTVGSFLGVEYVDMLQQGGGGANSLEHTIILDDSVVAGTLSFEELVDRGLSVSTERVQQRIDALTEFDYSDIVFTSGTTGKPKGVKLKHSQSLRAYGWLTEMYTFRRGDSFAIVPPFFHTFGYKCGWLANIIHGVKTIPMRTFDSVKLLETIEQHKVTTLVGPPTLFVDLINSPHRGAYDISSLRVGVPSSAKVSVKLVEDMRDVLGFKYVLNAYGLTEATSMVATCLPDDDVTVITTTVGRPAKDVEVMIVDDDENPQPPGTAGEIFVRGFNVMDGYWDDPIATLAIITPDGWLRTGDIGVFDARGYLKITDRKKDMYIVGGFNAYPAEIEESLGRFDKIMHVAVIGVEDERLGEVGWAYVVPKPGASVTEAEVVSYAREHLANFKVPRRVLIVDDLPRNSSLKVLKNELRSRAKEPADS